MIPASKIKQLLEHVDETELENTEVLVKCNESLFPQTVCRCQIEIICGKPTLVLETKN